MMHKFLMAALLAASTVAAQASAPTDFRSGDARPAPDNLRMADPRVLERLREADRRNPGLPRHMTEREKQIWQLPELTEPLPRDLPDYTFLRPPAEYERNDAILLSWQWPTAVVTSLVVPITTGDSRARVKLVVSGPSQEASVSTTTPF